MISPRQREEAFAEAISLLEGEYVGVVEDLFVTRDNPDLKLVRKLLRTVETIVVLEDEMAQSSSARTAR